MRPGSPLLLAGLTSWLVAGGAGAESALRLPLPQHYATVPAATYDTHGDRVGEAHVVLERLPDGLVRMLTETGFEAGPRTVISALLEPLADGSGLRPLWQESRSFDREGQALGRLRVDHQRRVGSCVPGPDLDPRDEVQIELPDRDRVANVALSMLFLPLAQGQTDEIEFQIFLCGGGPRVLDFHAEVAGPPGTGRPWVEIRYGPDLGPLGVLLAPVLPQLSVWLDPQARQPWLAHRVPLYAQGPEVLVVRDGVAARLLVSEP